MSNDNKKTNIEDPKERSLVELILEKKEPKTEFEKKLQKQIEEIKKSGGIVDIPQDV